MELMVKVLWGDVPASPTKPNAHGQRLRVWAKEALWPEFLGILVDRLIPCKRAIQGAIEVRNVK